MQNRKELIVRLSKFTVEQISDACDKLKLVDCIVTTSKSGIKPISSPKPIAGTAFTVAFHSNSCDKHAAIYKHNRHYLDEVPESSIVAIDCNSNNYFSVWGGLLSQFAYKHNIAGTVTNGCVRDPEEIKESSYPVFAAGVSPISSNGRYKVVAVKKPIKLGGIDVAYGDFMLASSSGVAVIKPKDIIKVLALAENKFIKEKK